MNFTRAPRASLLVPALTAGMVVAVTGPAFAGHGNPSTLDAACDGAPPSMFVDRAAYGERLQRVADCLAGYETEDGEAVLEGTADSLADFETTVSRAQYAAILLRVARIGGATVPEAPAEPTFPDVPTDNAFYTQIEEAVGAGLFRGTNVQDTDDLDEDGDTTETLFLPEAEVTYAQVVQSAHNLMVTLGQDVETVDENASETSLDCRAFDQQLQQLEGRSLLNEGVSTLPEDCIDPALRGEAFDLIAGAMSYLVAVGDVDNPYVGDPALITDLRLVDTEAEGDIDDGDQIVFVFDREMDPSSIDAADDVITFTDGDGQQFEVSCGEAAANCSLSAGDDPTLDNDELVVTVTADTITQIDGPADDELGVTAGAQAPAELDGLSADFRTSTGESVDVDASEDTTIDVEEEA